MSHYLNIIVSNGYVQLQDMSLFPSDEEVFKVESDKDMYDLLVMLGAFTSKSQARKNWKKTGASIPLGWSEFTVGKDKRQLCIWNPKEPK